MQNKEVLFYHFLIGKLTKEEEEKLENWIREDPENMKEFRKYIQNFKTRHNLIVDEELAYSEVINQIDRASFVGKKRMHALKYAAIFIFAIALALVVSVRFSLVEPPETVLGNSTDSIFPSQKIGLHLWDGTYHKLANGENGYLKNKNGNIVATNVNGTFSFNHGKFGTEGFNEVFVPYGNTLKLELSDHTKIWLNAGSKLRFPQHFNEETGQRTVYLEGEAFFDVRSNAELPFVVNVEGLNVKVLGTKFNVHAYASDKTIKTTLVEGEVKVYEKKRPEQVLLLKPNYQATYDKGSEFLEKKEVDTRIFTGWMQNTLVIDNLSFEEILNRLERIHNVKIINTVAHLADEMYVGEFQNESIETVLNTIAVSTPFQYKIKDNIITITK